jgi:hypothetical protein
MDQEDENIIAHYDTDRHEIITLDSLGLNLENFKKSQELEIHLTIDREVSEFEEVKYEKTAHIQGFLNFGLPIAHFMVGLFYPNYANEKQKEFDAFIINDLRFPELCETIDPVHELMVHKYFLAEKAEEMKTAILLKIKELDFKPFFRLQWQVKCSCQPSFCPILCDFGDQYCSQCGKALPRHFYDHDIYRLPGEFLIPFQYIQKGFVVSN